MYDMSEERVKKFELKNPFKGMSIEEVITGLEKYVQGLQELSDKETIEDVSVNVELDFFSELLFQLKKVKSKVGLYSNYSISEAVNYYIDDVAAM